MTSCDRCSCTGAVKISEGPYQMYKVMRPLASITFCSVLSGASVGATHFLQASLMSIRLAAIFHIAISHYCSLAMLARCIFFITRDLSCWHTRNGDFGIEDLILPTSSIQTMFCLCSPGCMHCTKVSAVPLHCKWKKFIHHRLRNLFVCFFNPSKASYGPCSIWIVQLVSVHSWPNHPQCCHRCNGHCTRPIAPLSFNSTPMLSDYDEMIYPQVFQALKDDFLQSCRPSVQLRITD